MSYEWLRRCAELMGRTAVLPAEYLHLSTATRTANPDVIDRFGCPCAHATLPLKPYFQSWGCAQLFCLTLPTVCLRQQCCLGCPYGGTHSLNPCNTPAAFGCMIAQAKVMLYAMTRQASQTAC